MLIVIISICTRQFDCKCKTNVCTSCSLRYIRVFMYKEQTKLLVGQCQDDIHSKTHRQREGCRWGAHTSQTHSTGQKDPQKMDFKKYFSSLNQSQLSLLTEFHVPTRYSPMARQSAHTARQMMMQERLSFLAYTYPLLCLGQSRHSSFKLRYKCSKRNTYNYSFFNRTVKNEMYCLPSWLNRRLLDLSNQQWPPTSTTDHFYFTFI